MAVETFETPKTFPSRGAAEALREHVVEFLRRSRPTVGERFLTDAELVEQSRLSRSTVRRALDELHREGWIERRIGSGTFVGPRAAYPEFAGAPAPLEQPRANGSGGRQRSVVRLAVLIFEIGDLAHDWYTPSILEGLDRAAEEHGISVELLGNRDRDVDAISRRLASTRPDVLACLAAEPKQAFVIRDAQKLDIPCIVTGTPHLGLGLPCVMEDNRQGMKLAVRHLVERGHRRIGLALQRHVERWVMDRDEAFAEALEEAGIDPAEFPVHYLPMGQKNQVSPGGEAALARYIHRHKLTALIPGSLAPMLCVDRLVRSGALRVPEDLSLVGIEQDLVKGSMDWLGERRPTTLVMPLKEMGSELARLARLAAERKELPPETHLPCRISAGDTVRLIGPASPSESSSVGTA